MASKAAVPVDLVSEQKNVLGIVSTRQASYIGGTFIMVCVIGNGISSLLNPLFGSLGTLIILAFIGVFFEAIACFFAFAKKHDYYMYYDQYLLLTYLQATDEFGRWEKTPDKNLENAIEIVKITTEDNISITKLILGT